MRVALAILTLYVACCTGCTTVHEFSGKAINLKGLGDHTLPDKELKISINCSGQTSSGYAYEVFYFHRQRSWLVLSHPDHTPSRHFQGTTDSNSIGAWLVRNTKPVCSKLALLEIGDELPDSECLQGTIHFTSWRGPDDFQIHVDLIGESGKTMVRGNLLAYSGVWRPLVGPAMLFGFGGAKLPKQ